MSLAQYDAEIGQYLTHIRDGAEKCLRNVQRLMERPKFETLAEADLELCERELVTALQTIHYAQAIFKGKPCRKSS